MVEGGSPLPFDAVEIDDGSGPRRVSAAELAAIPLSTRVRLLLEGKLRFLFRDQPIDAQAALKALAENARRARAR